MSQLDRIEYSLEYNDILRNRYKLNGVVWDIFLYMSLMMFIMMGLVSYYALTKTVSPEIMRAMQIGIMVFKPYLFILAGLYAFYIIWTVYQIKKLDRMFNERLKGGDETKNVKTVKKEKTKRSRSKAKKVNRRKR